MARSTPLPIPSHEREFIWSNSHSMSSEDGFYARPAMPRSPSPSMPTWIGQGPTSVLHTGQLSPVSPGMDPDGSSVSSAANSAASSYTDSWSLDGLAKDDMEVNTPWTSDDAPIPKVEVTDDDEFDMNLLDRASVLQDRRGSCAGPGVDVGLDDKGQKLKRPRGRPRKHPLTPVVGINKTAKGRSKTGCITCRKRKKKCDEAKPRCMNCEKNAVVCEGYHEKQIWKSGKERAEEARLRRESLPMITMPPIFHGVETAEDKIIWRHYCNRLGNVLTVEGEHRNAFKDMILQLATRHRGLMHSILSLSAGHMDHEAPYGLKVLREAGGDVTAESLRARADFHHEEAMRCLYEDMARSEDKSDPEYMTVLTARYGQMLCLLLRTVVEGNPRGEHRVHLQAYRRLIDDSPPEDARFLAFITEFFEYHIFADELLSRGAGPEGRAVDAAAGADAGAVADWPSPSPSPSSSCPHPPRLIGVTDGLFGYMSEITRIREAIRVNVLAGADQVVDYPSLYRAAEIDAGIRRWAPSWPPGDTRGKVALLYQQTMWVYLFRTIYPPGSSAAAAAAAQGPGTLGSGAMKGMDPGPGGVPPFKSGAGGAARGPRMTAADDGDTTPSRAPSPPPIRRPESQDPRITVAVEESLSILESFQPSDPSQRLLLIPCLILGTACFTPAQQGRVRAAVRAVRGYTGMGNCDLVAALLDEVWGLMGRGEWMRVWDWEGVARELGLDFLCA